MSYLELPNTLQRIERHSIVRCMNLRSLNIPASVRSIDPYNNDMFDNPTIDYEYAFLDNFNMSELMVDPGNQYFSAVDNVLFDKNQTTLLFSPIARTTTDYTIPSTVTSIYRYAFYRNNLLESVTIPNTIKEICVCIREETWRSFRRWK